MPTFLGEREPNGTKLYRTLIGSKPILDDFRPDKEMKPRSEFGLSLMAKEMREGFSASDDLTATRELARKWGHGDYIAILETSRLSEDVSVEKTSNRRDHFTLKGPPQAFMDAVASVVPVDATDIGDESNV